MSLSTLGAKLKIKEIIPKALMKYELFVESHSHTYIESKGNNHSNRIKRQQP